MAKRPAVPAGMGTSGTALWKEIAWKYDLRPDELKILRDACAAADFQEVLENDINNTLLKTQGSQGQDVINPSIPEWRQYSNLVTSHLLKLKLPDEVEATKGAAVSKQAAANSGRARAAARARWGTAV